MRFWDRLHFCFSGALPIPGVVYSEAYAVSSHLEEQRRASRWRGNLRNVRMDTIPSLLLHTSGPEHALSGPEDNPYTFWERIGVVPVHPSRIRARPYYHPTTDFALFDYDETSPEEKELLARWMAKVMEFNGAVPTGILCAVGCLVLPLHTVYRMPLLVAAGATGVGVEITRAYMAASKERQDLDDFILSKEICCGSSWRDMDTPYHFSGSKLTPWQSIDITKVDGLSVAVLCGSFNPIHQTHIDMFHAVRDELAIIAQRIKLVGGFVSPVNDDYGKKGLCSFDVRASISRAALTDHPQLSLDEWEGKQSTFTRTVFVLEHIQEVVQNWYETAATPTDAQRAWLREHPLRVIFICGTDLFASFMRPGCWSLALLKRLLDGFDVFVVRRAGGLTCAAILQQNGTIVEDKDAHASVPSLNLGDYRFMETERLNSSVSSTQIRDLLTLDPMANLDGLIPHAAQTLVRQNYAAK